MSGLTRVHLLGVEYACSCDKAIACSWTPMPEEQERAKVQEFVVACGRECRVEVFARGIFSKSVIRSVVIPNTVTFLPEKCFESCEHLVDVTFSPASRVSSFGKACFKRCGLLEIQVPNSCVLIGSKCFDCCTQLRHVSIGERSQLEEIGDFAFRGCDVSNLYLPSGLFDSFWSDTRGEAFVGVKSVTLGNNPKLVMLDDCLMLRDRRLIHCFSSKSVCEIPDSVCEIYRWCFSGSKVKKVIFGTKSKVRDLEGVFAGSSVEEIVFQKRKSHYFVKDGALLRLDGNNIELIFRMTHNELIEMSPYLTSVKGNFFGNGDPLKIVRFDVDCRNMTIPDSAFRYMDITDVFIHGVANVPSKCFYQCRFLKNVSFSQTSTVHVFARKSFSMTGLERLHVPRSVQQICSKCFCDCKFLKEITFEEGSFLESIEEKAFMNTSLTRLVVPCGVSTVTGTSFYGIPEVIFSESGFLSICGDFVIHNQRKCLVCFVGDASDEVVIPATIRVVGRESFYRCGHIKRISFESSSEVEIIEDDAFKHCWVDQLHIPNCLSSFGQNVLNRVGSVVVDEGNPSFDWNSDLFFTRVFSDQSIRLVNVIGSDDVIHVPDYVSSISSLSHHGQRGFVLSFSPNDLCEMRTFGPDAFRSTDIISITFPAKTESIHSNCFEKCDLLLNISFCGCYFLRSFGDSCFMGASISKIVVPSCIEILGKSCFANCVGLVEVEFEENSKLRFVEDKCFRKCVSLRVVVLPDSVQVIGDWAFKSSLISEFRFPSSLTQLGVHCFSRNLAKISSLHGLIIQAIPISCFNESQLKSVEIPAGVLKIERKAFEDCRYLETVTFERGSRLQNIEEYAFRRTCLTEISLPSTLQSIGKRAFQCTKLVEICLPKRLQELGDLVFADCLLLRAVKFEEGSSIANIKGQNVFKRTVGCHIAIPGSVVKFKGNFLPVGCSVVISSENNSYICDDHFVYNIDRTKLVRCFKPESSVVIPNSVQCIESGCFEDCQCICEVCFEEGSELREMQPHVFKNLELTRLVLPKGFKSIGPRSFSKCKLGRLEFEGESQLTMIDQSLGHVDLLILPELVEQVRPSALVDVRRVNVNTRSEYFHSEGHFLLSKDHQMLVFMFDMDVVDVVIPKSVRVLKKKCFSGRRHVSSIRFDSDSDLRVIESRALQDTSIESFCVPRLVEQIEDKAFSGCAFLKDLVFDDDCVLTSLSCGIFEGTHLRSLYIPSHVESIEPRSLCGIQHISISPKNVHLGIESDEFKRGCGLSTLGSFDDRHVFIFDSSIESIPCHEFSENEDIQEVSFSECHSLLSIGEGAFENSSLCSISLPSSIESLGKSCFYGCTVLTSILLSDDSALRFIGEHCFYGSGIRLISIPRTVQEIADGCFFESHLRHVNFGMDSSIERLGDGAFASTGLVRVLLPKSVQFLGGKCFANCSCLVSVAFEKGSNLRSIGEECFVKTKIDEIIIPAKVSELEPHSLTGIENISIDGGNPNFYFEKPFLFSIDGLTLKSFFGDVSEVTIPDFVEVIGARCFDIFLSLISCVRFNSSSRLKVIDDFAFSGTSIRSLALPKSVERMGEGCFWGCRIMTLGLHPNCELGEIGEGCFSETLITSIDFRNARKLKILGSQMFQSSALKEVIFSRNIECICQECFYDTEELLIVVFEDGSNLRIIERSAFKESALQSIELPERLEEIGPRAFCKCQKLCDVSIHESTPLKVLSKSLFKKTLISSICIPNAVQIIEASCFDGCEFLSELKFPSESCLEEIGCHAFRRTGLVRVCLPREVRKLCDECFAECSKLERFEFVDDAQIRVIDGRDILKGVHGCVICIPEHLWSFERSLIPDGCVLSISPKNMNFACDDQFIFNGQRDKLVMCLKDVGAVRIPPFVRVIRKRSFCNCTNLHEVCFEADSRLVKIGASAFCGCKFDHVVLPSSVRVFKSAFQDCMINRLEFEEGSEIEDIDSLGCSVIDELVLPKMTKCIDFGTLCCARSIIVHEEAVSLSLREHFLLSKDHQMLVFMFDMDVVDVVIPKSVRVLKKKCFSGRRHVSSIRFESDSDLRVIESRALQDTSIESFCVPRLVEQIEDKAFSGCAFLKDLVFDDDCVLTSLNRGIFEGTHLRSLYIPSHVESIEPRSLCGIQHISISPKNVHLGIESDEFKRGCGLSTLGSFDDRHVFIFDSSVESIPCHEFSENDDIQEVSFSECKSVVSIGDGAFENSSLCSISLPSSIESLGKSCFSGCTKLTSAEFSSDCALSVLPACLFSRASVESIIVPPGVQEIGSRCFANSPLSSLEFSEGTCLRVIGNEAFRHTSLEMVTLPKTVLEIGDMCFADTSSLSSFVFCEGSELQRIGIKCFKGTSIKKIQIPPFVHEIGFGSLSDIKKVVIDEENDHFVSDGSLLLSKDGSVVHGCLRSASHLELPLKAVRVMKGSFIENAHSIFVVIPRNVEYLGNECFSGCQVLEEVTFLPQSKLGFVGNGCFAECRRLTNVSFDDLSRLKIFPEEMFRHTRIRSIHVPKIVRVIQSRCFYGCSALSSLEFYPDCCLKRICDEAFSCCGLVNVHFPRSLIALGDGAFSGCSRLKSVSFAANSSLQFIGSNCFQCKCSFELPETIYMIKGDSFGHDCEVHMKSNNEMIIEAFEEWKNDCDHSFVNPTMEANDFIKGVFNLCDCGYVGSGGQGVVKVKQSMISGEIFAVKVIDYGSFRGQDKTGLMWEEFKSRTSDMQQLHHPCLVKIKGCCFDDDRWRITVFMDYIKGPPVHDESCCSSGSVNLKTVLEKRPSWWTKSVLSIVILGITRGIDYIHNSGLVHRDLKPSNVLIDEKFHCKICDFDVGRRLDFEDSGMTVNVGTLKYMAPECASGKYSAKSDYYSFGVLLYEIFEGTESTCRSCVDSSSVCFSEATPVGIQEFIRDCLILDPDERACNLDDDRNPLFSSLYNVLCEHMNFDENEMISVQEFVASVEMEEDEIFANES